MTAHTDTPPAMAGGALQPGAPRVTDEDQQLLQALGIDYEVKLIFRFQGHRYDRLADAVAYARTHQTTAAPSPGEAS